MTNSAFASPTDSVTIGTLTLPVRTRGGSYYGDMRILIGEGEAGGYEVLAGRLEFLCNAPWVPACEMPLAGGDVVLGLREGRLEEVVVVRTSEALDWLISHPVPGVPFAATEALRCIRHVWRRLTSGVDLGAVLSGTAGIGGALGSGPSGRRWTFPTRVRVTWTTV